MSIKGLCQKAPGMQQQGEVREMGNELYHYGILGQKWGIRRYQNADGSLTSEGRKRYRQEVREDNKKAFEYGKEATVLGRATKYSANRAAKSQDKVDKLLIKDPNAEKRRTQRAIKNEKAAEIAAISTAEAYAKARQRAEDHCKQLMEKYGKENVKGISYKDVKVSKSAAQPNKLGQSSLKVVNEKTKKMSEWAVAGATWAGAAAIMATGVSPIAFVYTPYSTNDMGRMAADRAYYKAKAQV